jgi:hypothetical protein
VKLHQDERDRALKAKSKNKEKLKNPKHRVLVFNPTPGLTSNTVFFI